MKEPTLFSNLQPLTKDDLLGVIVRLNGEAHVMRCLLREAHDVIETVEGETAPECEMLADLQNKIRAAYQGSI